MKQGRTAIAVGVLCLLVSSCLAVSPGFRTVFTNKGLDYSKQLVVITVRLVLVLIVLITLEKLVKQLAQINHSDTTTACISIENFVVLMAAGR